MTWLAICGRPYPEVLKWDMQDSVKEAVAVGPLNPKP
jgi:hypothetical protein